MNHKMDMKKTIDPLWGYWVTSTDYLTEFDRQVLVDLYQPLIGSNAISLYQLLWNHQEFLVSERKAHAQLLNLLDMDGRNFYNARIKVEAVALMHTYSAKDALGEYLIYQLHTPLHPNKFFNDGILRTFLYEKIGQEDFLSLQKKYQSPSLPQNQQLTDITHNFLDVFHLASADILDTKVQDSTVTHFAMPHYTTQQLSTFDWELLQQLTTHYQVNPTDIKDNQNAIFNIHAFYGVTEMEMADLIANTLNVTNNQIDIQRLQNVAQKRFEDRVNISNRNKQTTEVKVQDTPISGFSNKENKLLQQANKMPPAEFLAMKKNQLHGFVGSSETGVLRRLQQRAVLPLPVINILVDYILDNSATLTQGLVEKVANDWAQKGIKTAPEALRRIKEHTNNSSKVRTNSHKSKYKTYQPHQEQVTDWSKHQAKKVDPQTFAAAQKKLREFEEQ